MAPQPVTIFGLQSPVYLRFMTRTKWGESGDPEAERIANAAGSFDGPNRDFSFFLVNTEEEAKLAVLAFVRPRKPGAAAVVPFLPDEVTSVPGVLLNNTLGETTCKVANRLHVDVRLEDEAAVRQLCQTAMGAGRDYRYFTAKELERLDAEAAARNCRASRAVEATHPPCGSGAC